MVYIICKVHTSPLHIMLIAQVPQPDSMDVLLCSSGGCRWSLWELISMAVSAFLLWRSVYITKQVSFRNRVPILFDWMKAQVFGRDLSQF